MGIKGHVIHHMAGLGVKALGKYAGRHQGSQQWAFSQSRGPDVAVTGPSEHSGNGICNGLSVRSLIGHGVPGQGSLRDFITRPDGGINGPNLSQVASNHVGARGRGGLGAIDLLRHAGFTPRQEAKNGYRGAINYVDMTVSETNLPSRANCAEGLARDLVRIGAASQQRPAYCLITIGAMSGGVQSHAMAAIASPGSIRFFDPNAGEYQFQDADNFRR